MLSLHSSRCTAKFTGPFLGSALVLSSAAAVAFYLNRRKTDAEHAGEEHEVEKTVLITGWSVEELVRFASDPGNLDRILARAEDYRGEADGSFTVRFSAFGQSTEVLFGQVEARPPDQVKYGFSKGVSSRPLGELYLHFKALDRETLVSGKLIAGDVSPLPDPLQKLVGKGWVAFTLRQLKMLAEAGEIATTKGQPSGRETNH